jgi:hypothetical protein
MISVTSARSSSESCGDSPKGIRIVGSDRRARWSLCKRQQNGSQCRGGLVGPRLLVDRELKVRKPRQPFFRTENAQARDQRAGRKRCDGEARERRRAHACQTGAGIDDLPGAPSAASRETDRSRYRASGSAAPGTRSNVSRAAARSAQCSRYWRSPPQRGTSGFSFWSPPVPT